MKKNMILFGAWIVCSLYSQRINAGNSTTKKKKIFLVRDFEEKRRYPQIKHRLVLQGLENGQAGAEIAVSPCRQNTETTLQRL
jgi:hypothetical protein